jgi:hypothetical protein
MGTSAGTRKREWSTKSHPLPPPSAWIVYKGTSILVPNKNLEIDSQVPARHNKFSVIVSSKTVVYEDSDVCLDPKRDICSIGCLYNSIFEREENYYGFLLPTNKKKVIFILVSAEDVTMKFGEEKDLVEDFLDKIYDLDYNLDEE